jgi:uncharacterized protein (TIGR00725 family)
MRRTTFPIPSASKQQPVSIHDCIAVLGGAKQFTEVQLRLGYTVGKAIAQAGKGVLTGATNGIPYAAAIGAFDHGGVVLGISPASNPREHRERYGRPTDYHDHLIYTGLGLEVRSLVLVRSAQAVVFVGGEAGTLHEFTGAWIGGTPVIGVLTNSGGITDELPGIAASFSTSFGSRIVTANDPEGLVTAVCAALAEMPDKTGVAASDVLHADNPVLQAVASLRPSAA